MILAYVPARGGSKEILRKNLIPVGGMPLLEWTIEAARASSSIDEVWVSTEDPEIRGFAQSKGARTAYERPVALAGDESTIVDGLLHFLDWLSSRGREQPEAVVVLQPTSPLRDGALIDSVVAEFRTGRFDSIFSVSEVSQHPREVISWVGGARDWDYLVGRRHGITQRQTYESNFFFMNGSMYVVSPDFVRREKALVVPGVSVPYTIPQEFGLEVDSAFDLMLLRRVVGRES